MDRNYYLNPKIKRSELAESYTPEQIKEYIKCSEDPVYFIENYVQINSLDKGFVNFKLRGYQDELIRGLNENQKSIILSSRQSGKCFFINTIVTVRNKKTGEIKETTIDEFHENCKKELSRVLC